MRQYEMFELEFRGTEPEGSFVEIDLEAVFSCEGEKRTVKGFYAGNGIYKVRFLPEKAGTYTWKVTGILEQEGEACCEGVSPVVPQDAGARQGSGHGPVRAEEMHFVHADGTPFYPFGTTVYALIHQEDRLTEETMESLKNAPFNKIRFCVFPKHYDFNHNEPPYYAFDKKEDGSWDVNRPCFAFWERLEKILARLEKMAVQADLILFHPYDRWGFAGMPQEDNLIYLDYLLRRIAAFPNVWWSLANEYDLCEAKSIGDWEQIEDFVAQHDPYRHLLSNHNCFKNWDFTRPHITHACIQSKVLNKVAEWRRQYQKPVVIDECCYEGNIQHIWGSISGREMTNRFWRVVTMGGYCTHGETFLDPEQEVLWWSKGGRLKGESPARIAFLRQIVEQLPGPIEPVENRIMKLIHMTDEEKEQLSAQGNHFVKAMLRMGGELIDFCNSEFVYQGHCGEDAYLTFYDRRTCAEDVLELPETHSYKIELIDTWDMTRTVLAEKAKGSTKLSLPGREGMAVLVLKTD